MVKALLERDPPANINYTNNHEWTVLMIAAFKICPELIRYLVVEQNVDVNHKNPEGRSLVLFAVFTISFQLYLLYNS